jgi:hypothetical protein
MRSAKAGFEKLLLLLLRKGLKRVGQPRVEPAPSDF